MGALPAKQNQYVEYAEKDAKMRSIADAIDSASEGIDNTQKMIAPEFSATQGYSVGDIVRYEGKLYRFVKGHYGAWNSSDVLETDVDTPLRSNRVAISNAVSNLAAFFSTTSTYAVGDYVIYNNLLWVCTTAIETAGNWTGDTNWTRADKIVDMIKTTENVLNGTSIGENYYDKEGDIEITLGSGVSGFFSTYAHWRISNSKLSIVLSGYTKNLTTAQSGLISAETTTNTITLPDEVYERLIPNFPIEHQTFKGILARQIQNVVRSTYDYYTEGYGKGPEITAVVMKISNNRVAISFAAASQQTMSDDYNYQYRFEFNFIL